jgi:hypothetical protein
MSFHVPKLAEANPYIDQADPRYSTTEVGIQPEVAQFGEDAKKIVVAPECCPWQQEKYYACFYTDKNKYQLDQKGPQSWLSGSIIGRRWTMIRKCFHGPLRGIFLRKVVVSFRNIAQHLPKCSNGPFRALAEN